MRLFCVGLYTVVFTGHAFAGFDHYKVTDLGFPVGHKPSKELFSTQYTSKQSVISASWPADGSSLDQSLYSSQAFSKFSPPHTDNIPSPIGYACDAGWTGYGINGRIRDERAGFYKNGVYTNIEPVSGAAWTITGAWGASESKYLAAFEATEEGSLGVTRPMLYEVATGQRTFLPQIEQNTYICAALDSGVCAVGSNFASAGYYAWLWKNGHYSRLTEDFLPVALSRTEWIAGTSDFSGDTIFLSHNGTTKVKFIPGFHSVRVTGVSDLGVVSTYDPSFGSAYLVSTTDVTKIDDLVVNKPSDMTIYGASINYDGHMFGQAKVGNEHHFVLLDPVPEPATWLVVGLGAVVLLRRKARN